MMCSECGGHHPAWAMSVDVDLCQYHYIKKKREELELLIKRHNRLVNQYGSYEILNETGTDSVGLGGGILISKDNLDEEIYV